MRYEVEFDHANEDYIEFRRLNKPRYDALEKYDRDYLRGQWYYLPYKSFDRFLQAFPRRAARERLIESLRREAVLIARAQEELEFMAFRYFGIEPK